MNPYVLKRPIITEKTLWLANRENVYTFEVVPTATRLQIAQAIQQAYGVHVIGVNTVMRAVSTKRTGRKRQNVSIPRTKKALIKVKKGQTIALFDIQNTAEQLQAAKALQAEKAANAAKTDKSPKAAAKAALAVKTAKNKAIVDKAAQPSEKTAATTTKKVKES